MALGISVKTAETHRSTIPKQVGLRNGNTGDSKAR